MMQYFDKHSNEIKAGMFLRMEDGSIEEIYACTDSYGKRISASMPAMMNI